MAGMSKMKPGLASDAVNLAFIEEVTRDADAVQGRVLSVILGRNGESEYLTEKCGLSSSGSVDRAAFRAKVPMATYEDLLPYIRRIADGERSHVLTGAGNPVTELFTSSGTSGGERKMIPTVEDEVDRRYLLEGLFTTVMNQHVPGIDKGKSMYFLFVSSQSKTSGGLTAGTVMTSYYKSKQYAAHAYPQNNTSPTAAILCEDAAQSTYAQVLCGLCQRLDVMHVGAVFAVALVRAVRFLQDNWDRLAADIEAGDLMSGVVTDPAVREAVAAVLRGPDPELAAFVRAECGKGEWAGIIPRIWPNTRYLGTVVTGSMAQYVPTLDYYSGGLPMASDIWGASEGDFGLNLSPLCDPYEASYTIMPNMAYFEFLPVVDDGDDARDQLVELAGVEAGREYEMVITTYAGLNRYRLGDVLRVTGFHNAAPMVRFVRRKNTLLSVDVDKTDEADLQRAVERASALLRPHSGAAVVEYTSRACTADIPGRYVIYWELRYFDNEEDDTVVNGDVLERCCLEMEEALGSVYRQKRVEDGSIAPLQIRVVQTGTFEKLLDYAISRGTSIAQYKVPRCVTENPPVIDLLDSRVVSTHVSSALPHWAPDQPSNNY